jgi:heat shock protein HtpX
VKGFEKRAKGLFSTHPPIEERIQILRSMETGGIPQTAG